MACAARVLGNVVVSFEADVAPAPEPAVKPLATVTEADEGLPRVRTKGKAPTAVADPLVGRVVVLGNGIAGVTAADHVRRHHPDCELTLVAEERHDFYNRTSVSRLVYSRAGMSGMYLLPPSWYADRKIATWLNTRATRIDRPRRRVVLGTGEELSYDRLVLATGSRSRTRRSRDSGSKAPLSCAEPTTRCSCAGTRSATPHAERWYWAEACSGSRRPTRCAGSASRHDRRALGPALTCPARRQRRPAPPA